MQEALSSWDTNSTIILKEDIELAEWLVFSTWKSITLDLSGHTITWNNSILTVNDWMITIKWNWKMELRTDWTVITVKKWVCTIENGDFVWWPLVYAEWSASKVTIKWWEFNGTRVWNRTAIHATKNAVIDIEWWNFIATVTNEKEWSNKNLKVIYAWGNDNKCHDPNGGEKLIGGTINVNGWTFYGRLSKSNKGTYNIKWWTFKVTEVAWINCDYDIGDETCKGDKPNSNRCEYWKMQDMVAPGYIARATANSWEYQVSKLADSDEESVVCIWDKCFPTLQDAVNDANNGDTISVVKNIVLEDSVDFSKIITLDLNWHAITPDESSITEHKFSVNSNHDYLLSIKRGWNLTIKDSSDGQTWKIDAKALLALKMTIKGEPDGEKAILNINGWTFIWYWYAISGNGNRHNTEVNISWWTFIATADGWLAIYHPQNWELNISWWTFSWHDSAVELRSWKLRITWWVFVSTADTYKCNPNGNGKTTVWAAIAISQHTTKKAIDIMINSWEFKWVNALSICNPQGNDVPVPTVSLGWGVFNWTASSVINTDARVENFIKGWIFNKDPSAYIYTGYKVGSKRRNLYSN